MIKYFKALIFLLFFAIQGIAQENGGKIAIEGDRLFVVLPNHGFSIYDVRNPRAPRQIRFVECPGIIDIAVRDEFIYASRYEELYLLKVPKNPKEPDSIIRYETEVFKTRGNPHPGSVKVQFFSNFDSYKKTQLNLKRSYRPAGNAPSISQNGSMSSISLIGDYIYVVDGSELSVYDARPFSPNCLKKLPNSLTFPNGQILETVWTNDDSRLYVGSQTGVFVVDISTREMPRLIGGYPHVQACDPVIASGNYAYSTLRSGTHCQHAKNWLVVLDISKPESPTLVTRISLVNPHGLAIDGTNLIVCDGSAGLRVFDIRTPSSPVEISHNPLIKNAYDVLINAVNKTAFVSVPGKLHVLLMVTPSAPVSQSVIELPKINLN